MTRPAVDVARIFVASLAALTIGLAAYIAVAYIRAWFELDQDPVTRVARWGPLQVAGIALSHCMYTTYGATRLVDRIGYPFNWEGPYLVVAALLSFLVLLFAARKERRRIAAVRAAERAGHPLRRAADR